MGEKLICIYCEEFVNPGDLIAFPIGTPAHFECQVRATVGSVGHLMKRCSCYGGTEDDPLGMTKREAAKAAWVLFCKQSREKT